MLIVVYRHCSFVKNLFWNVNCTFTKMSYWIVHPSLLAKLFDHIALIPGIRWSLHVIHGLCSYCDVRLQTEQSSDLSSVQWRRNRFVQSINRVRCGRRGFSSAFLHCLVKHVLCVFSQTSVKSKCHVVYFEMLLLTQEMSCLFLLSPPKERTQLPDYHSSIL